MNISTLLNGSNTKSPKLLHIDYAKEVYQASNKKDYVWQMTVWLGRQEAVACFRAYLDYVIPLDPKNLNPTPPNNKTYENKDNEDLYFEHTDLSHPMHSVAIKPAFPHMDFNTLTTHFKVTNFIPTLSTFIHRLIPPPALPVLSNHIDCFDVYRHIMIIQPSNPSAGFPKTVDCLCATPLVPANGRYKAVPAHFD